MPSPATPVEPTDRARRRRAAASALICAVLATAAPHCPAGVAAAVAPPAVAARLSVDPDAAVDAVRIAVAAAQQAAVTEAALFGAELLLGAPSTLVTRGGGDPTARLGCHDLLGPALCSGSARVEADRDAKRGAAIPAGAEVRVEFDRVLTHHGVSDLEFDGRLSLRFGTTLEADPARWTRETVEVRYAGYRGRYAGLAFGPTRGVARLEIDAVRGLVATTRDGVRTTGVGLVEADGGSAVGGGTVRLAHPRQPGRYVDAAFANWTITGGRPAAGSATVSAAGPVRFVVRVLDRDAATVGYAVVAERGRKRLGEFRVIGRYEGDVATYAPADG